VLPPLQWLLLGTWLGVGLMCTGIGTLAARLCGERAIAGAQDLLRRFWLGWALLLVLLQVWHFFRPVNAAALPAFALAGAVGLVAGGHHPWLELLRRLPRRWPVVLAFAVLAMWLSNRALEGPRFGDTMVYHVPKVRWIVEHAITPGLGNLYIALAHNQTSFLYVALLDGGALERNSHHAAHGLLVLALMAQTLLATARALGRGSASAVDTYYMLCLPAVLGLGLSIFLTCPTPDMPVTMLGIVLSGEVVRVLCRSRPRKAPDFDLLVLALLATVAITVKLSIAGLAAAAGGVAFIGCLWRERPPARACLRTVIAMAVVIAAVGGLWMAGNVVLSGFALYPAPYGAMPVPWRLRFDMREWVEAIGLDAPLRYALSSPRWFVRRLQSLGWGTMNDLVALAAAGVGTLAMLVQLPVRLRRRGVPRVPVVVLLPTLVSLWYTLQYAPTPRYAGAALWLLAVQTVLVSLGGTAAGPRRTGRVVAFVAAVAVAAVPFAYEPQIWLRLREFPPNPLALVNPVELESGLTVQVPASDPGLCGFAPLPCTPHPHPALRLRRDGDLSSGFVMDPEIFERHRDTRWHAALPACLDLDRRSSAAARWPQPKGPHRDVQRGQPHRHARQARASSPLRGKDPCRGSPSSSLYFSSGSSSFGEAR
jgi:hypothetical protein